MDKDKLNMMDGEVAGGAAEVRRGEVCFWGRG